MPFTETIRQATDSPALRQQIQHLVNRLPPIEYHDRANGEIDFYGASNCIADQLGLPAVLHGRATWVHFWTWSEVKLPEELVDLPLKDVNNLVGSKTHETFLKQHGFPNATAVGVPFLYPRIADVPRIPDSLLVFPMHTTCCTSLTIHDETHRYVDYIQQLREQFSLVVASIGYEDVRRGNWIPAFEKAGIPWIAGAWSFDKHALARVQLLMRQFEFATSNNPGSHFAYAAYCGCKMSFSGPECETLEAELETHPHYKRYPDLAKSMKQRGQIEEFRTKCPFFCLEPREAGLHEAWARRELGEEHKKQPEEIAALFGWRLRKLPSGRWTPADPLDALSNEALFAKAMAKSLVGRHEDACKLIDALSRRQARLRDMDVVRARFFLHVNDLPKARQALEEELRHFPDNAQAAKMRNELVSDPFLAPPLSPEFADLHLVRKGILQRLEQAIPLFSGVLLDVGCGQMPYRDHILGRNPAITRYIGLDFASGKYAERRRPDLTWDGRAIPLPDASVDSAMATEVLEHCPDPLPVLREIRRVLRPGGVLFFTTPFLWPIHDAPHDHYRYTPYALQRLLEEAGFEDARVEALGGWNASLAQMLGLWLRRAPMADQDRARLTKELFPFYTELVRTDVVPTDFSRNPMITGLAGTARAAAPRAAQTPPAAGPRVIVITDQFPVLSQTFILEQITGLIDRGLAVEHWSLQRLDEPVVHDKARRYGLLEATRYVVLPPEALRADPARWTQAFLRTNQLAPLDDVAAVQIHFGPNFDKFAPLFAARPDLFTVVSFHGYDGSATLRIKGADVYAALFARADRITTPSAFMKEALIRHGCPPEKLVVHHYGKDVAAFAPTPRPGGRRPTRLLTVARFVEKKGLEYALAAFAKARAGLDVEYRIVGYGPLAPALEALARELGAADKVRFLGQLTNDAVRQEMAQADVFALTSVTASNGDQEGVPVSLIEAQALGLPVISSRHAGIPELVVHGETGFLAAERDVDEIAGYMRALFKNPAIRATFAANARERVLREFDLDKLNDALADLLLGRGPKSAAPAGREPNAAAPEQPGKTPYFCPICRSRLERFRPFGTPPRPGALCPNCTSLERHRALWLFLERRTNLLALSGLRLLHFAPEACLEPRFRQLLGKGYVTADLLDPRAGLRADITNLPFPDASFDLVYCSHVLEHVPDDGAAMRELLRVLVPDGLAVVMVPLAGAVTQEDLSVTDPDERARRYGQADHVRYYGLDITDRLAQAGFAVTLVETAKAFPPQDIETMRLGNERIFLCRKPAAGQKDEGTTPSRSGKTAGTDQALRATARHWSTAVTRPRTRWWMHPGVLRHINALVCGSPLEGPWAGLARRMSESTGGRPFGRALSVGCGSASKELNLLEKGIVEHFDLFEISSRRVAQGQAQAERLGLAGRADFHEQDALARDLDDGYDLVYWNNALHHMFDVDRALAWSRERLRPGGHLVMDDFVGATRFQWPDEQLAIAGQVRRRLPERLLRDPEHPERLCPVDLTRPSLASMLAQDPSEAADSDNILPALGRVFPDAQILLTGGVVYNLALKDIIANFDPVQDAPLLQELLDFDAQLAARGQTHYACAFAVKPADAAP
jgi:glycosyltransferase involved in cell wall biosynthesis/SAM-dependent methyltransferase